MGMDIAIDIGTSRIRIYTPSKGVIIDEPCIVTINIDTNETFAFGEEAYIMLG